MLFGDSKIQVSLRVHNCPKKTNTAQFPMNFWTLSNQQITWLQALCKPKFIPSHAQGLFICLNQQPGHLRSL